MMYAKKLECRMDAETQTIRRKLRKSMWMAVTIRDSSLKLHCMIFSKLIRTVFESISLPIPVLFRQPVHLGKNMSVLNQMILYMIIY